MAKYIEIRGHLLGKRFEIRAVQDYEANTATDALKRINQLAQAGYQPPPVDWLIHAAQKERARGRGINIPGQGRVAGGWRTRSAKDWQREVRVHYLGAGAFQVIVGGRVRGQNRNATAPPAQLRQLRQQGYRVSPDDYRTVEMRANVPGGGGGIFRRTDKTP